MRFPAIFGGWRVEGYLCTGFWRAALVWPRFVRIWGRVGGWRRLRGPVAGLSCACSQAGRKTGRRASCGRGRVLGSGAWAGRPEVLRRVGRRRDGFGPGYGGRKQAPGVGDDERRRRVPLKGRGLYGQGVRVRVFRFWLASCQQDPVWDCEAFFVCARAYSFSCQIGSGSFGGGAGQCKKA